MVSLTASLAAPSLVNSRACSSLKSGVTAPAPRTPASAWHKRLATLRGSPSRTSTRKTWFGRPDLRAFIAGCLGWVGLGWVGLAAADPVSAIATRSRLPFWRGVRPSRQVQPLIGACSESNTTAETRSAPFATGSPDQSDTASVSKPRAPNSRHRPTLNFASARTTMTTPCVPRIEVTGRRFGLAGDRGRKVRATHVSTRGRA
jgi:hypothetical protein